MIELPLTRGLIAIIDDTDSNQAAYKWFAKKRRNRFYPARTDWSNGGKTVYLHRELLGAPEGVVVDHVNGNSLDCRRENLRLANHTQNARNVKKHIDNTSGFKGVTYVKPWRASITVDNKRKTIGCYETPEEAAMAYDKAARRYFGEFARVNFPDIPDEPL